jgi:serine/threonine-protein kinase
MPALRVIQIGKQIAEGLAATHAAGIVHRDLKPENVMLVTRGTKHDFVKILDFGIAKVGTNKMTVVGSVFGTARYMSPEQASGEPLDHRTDMYALGVILYEMAAGRVPFDADDMAGLITQHLHQPPAPIGAVLRIADVPAGLEAIILRCLGKKKEARYETMDELAADLHRVEQAMLSPGSTGDSPPIAAPRGPGPAVRGVLVMAALLSTLVVVLVVRSARRSLQPVPPASVAAASTAPANPTLKPTLTTPPSTAAAAAPAVPPVHEVIVTVVPGDATITRDERDLGVAPVALQLPDGETARVVAARKGYRSKTVTIDGSTRVVAIALEALPAPTVVGRPPRSVDDVGDPFAGKR